MTRPTWVYILLCADGRYYVGSYRGEDIDTRVSEHNMGYYPRAYTAKRLPVKLMWADTFMWATDAIEFERQLKGWSRAKKEAVIRGDWDALPELSRRGGASRRQSSTGSSA